MKTRNIIATAAASLAALALAIVPQTAMAGEPHPSESIEQTSAAQAYCDASKRSFGTDAYWQLSSDCSQLHLGTRYEGRIGTLPNTRPWYSVRYSIRQVTVDSPVKAHTDSSQMFYDMPYLTSIDLTGLDTSDATNMRNMFYKNPSLGSITLDDKFDTSKVTDMSYMFASNSTLKNLDLGDKFDTSEVTNMNHMFGGMKSVTSINMGPSFSTGNVITMASMFQGDSALKRLDLSGFDTAKISGDDRIDNMLEGCTNLRFVNVGANASFGSAANAPSSSWKSQDGNWTGDPALGFGQDSPSTTWYGRPEVSLGFNANGAQGAAPATMTRDAWPGDPAEFEMPGQGEMTKKDHILAGWAHDEDAVEPHYQTGSVFTLDNDDDTDNDTTMHAVWQRSSPEDGTEPDEDETGETGSEPDEGGTDTSEGEAGSGESEADGNEGGTDTDEGEVEVEEGETDEGETEEGEGEIEPEDEETEPIVVGPALPEASGHSSLTKPEHTTAPATLTQSPEDITAASDQQQTSDAQPQNGLASTGSSAVSLVIVTVTLTLIGLAITLRRSLIRQETM
ncbi:BspA family leucine-rich repeat surface protein [Bifidobacterium sp. ESL0728]|uniref:BspA family leucine-rich repeat surface protein n=1 Tax=Bifidobacterium sp. ESL0728 TaxID=2983220 RepID=UPI0023F79F02|nr:BspA family leucine-rich repeat surface protein [Bifidobacterium sp. ESL0728]WEV59133.1 BspA family leucine-rich repeat surface protein [Bifidobacterium sp. ESL0728]